MRLARKLGDDVTRRWRSIDFDERAFADIAGEALSSADGLEELSDLRAVLAATRLPEQEPDAPGVAAGLALYRNGRVAIEVQPAAGFDARIVRPGFAGAMRLGGRFASVEHTLVTEREVRSGLVTGRIESGPVEILPDGHVNRVAIDDRIGRCLIGLSPGSAVVTVRTDALRVAQTLRYLPPAFAFAVAQDDPAHRLQRLFLVQTVGSLPEAEAERLIETTIGASDLGELVRLLVAFADSSLPPSALERVVGEAERHRSARASRFGELVAGARRSRIFADVLREVWSEERLALAVLALSRDPREVCECVGRELPGAPVGDVVKQALGRAAQRVAPGDQTTLFGGPWGERVAEAVSALLRAPDARQPATPGRGGVLFGLPSVEASPAGPT